MLNFLNDYGISIFNLLLSFAGLALIVITREAWPLWLTCGAFGFQFVYCYKNGWFRFK